jgi:hypothetical protein
MVIGLNITERQNTNLEIRKFLHGIVRSWTSQTKNPIKSNSDASQLPGKYSMPRGPTQNPSGILRTSANINRRRLLLSRERSTL